MRNSFRAEAFLASLNLFPQKKELNLEYTRKKHKDPYYYYQAETRKKQIHQQFNLYRSRPSQFDPEKFQKVLDNEPQQSNTELRDKLIKKLQVSFDHMDQYMKRRPRNMMDMMHRLYQAVFSCRLTGDLNRVFRLMDRLEKQGFLINDRTHNEQRKVIIKCYHIIIHVIKKFEQQEVPLGKEVLAYKQKYETLFVTSFVNLLYSNFEQKKYGRYKEMFLTLSKYLIAQQDEDDFVRMLSPMYFQLQGFENKKVIVQFTMSFLQLASTITDVQVLEVVFYEIEDHIKQAQSMIVVYQGILMVPPNKEVYEYDVESILISSEKVYQKLKNHQTYGRLILLYHRYLQWRYIFTQDKNEKKPKRKKLLFGIRYLLRLVYDVRVELGKFPYYHTILHELEAKCVQLEEGNYSRKRRFLKHQFKYVIGMIKNERNHDRG